MTNGQTYGPAWFEEDVDFATILEPMDGASFFAYTLWHHPDTLLLPETDVLEHSDEYLQCAGTAAAMTVELREKSEYGFDQWVLATSPVTGGPDHTVVWDGDFSTTVHAEEVFTSEQAAPLFEAYFRTGRVPDSVPRRSLHPFSHWNRAGEGFEEVAVHLDATLASLLTDTDKTAASAVAEGGSTIDHAVLAVLQSFSETMAGVQGAVAEGLAAESRAMVHTGLTLDSIAQGHETTDDITMGW